MDLRLLYITAKNREDALRIGRVLLEERLVACVNVLPGATSLYRWKGTLEETVETIVIAKTTAPRVRDAIARVQALHGYECPCIVALPVLEGNPAFCAWVAGEASK